MSASNEHRITRVTTRTGDAGESGLADGSRLPKHHPRFDAMGTVDELNAVLGRWRTLGLPPEIDAVAEQVQHRLFDLGGTLAGGLPAPLEGIVGDLDQAIEQLNGTLPPLMEFILPGGHPTAAEAHVARTVARRAERRLATWLTDPAADPLMGGIPFLNRLSDWLFVAARHLNQVHGIDEPTWQRES